MRPHQGKLYTADLIRLATPTQQMSDAVVNPTEEQFEERGSREPRNRPNRVFAAYQRLNYLAEALNSAAHEAPTDPQRVLVVHDGPEDLRGIEKELGIPISVLACYVDTSDMAKYLGIEVDKNCQICKCTLLAPPMQCS